MDKLEQFQIPNDLWVWDNVKFTLEERFIIALHKGTLKCIADSSFYPFKSKYISVAWFISKDNIILANGEFITTVAEEYRHSFAAEICSMLSFLVIIDNILYKYLNTGGKVSIVVESDCQAVIDDL